MVEISYVYSVQTWYTVLLSISQYNLELKKLFWNRVENYSIFTLISWENIGTITIQKGLVRWDLVTI